MAGAASTLRQQEVRPLRQFVAMRIEEVLAISSPVGACAFQRRCSSSIVYGQNSKFGYFFKGKEPLRLRLWNGELDSRGEMGERQSGFTVFSQLGDFGNEHGGAFNLDQSFFLELGKEAG